MALPYSVLPCIVLKKLELLTLTSSNSFIIKKAAKANALKSSHVIVTFGVRTNFCRIKKSTFINIYSIQSILSGRKSTSVWAQFTEF